MGLLHIPGRQTLCSRGAGSSLRITGRTSASLEDAHSWGSQPQRFPMPQSCKRGLQNLVQPAVKAPKCILMTRPHLVAKQLQAESGRTWQRHSHSEDKFVLRSSHFICFTRQSILAGIYLVSAMAPESAVNLQSTVIPRLWELFSTESWESLCSLLQEYFKRKPNTDSGLASKTDNLSVLEMVQTFRFPQDEHARLKQSQDKNAPKPQQLTP